MAKLSNFRCDSNAIATGEWVSPGEEYADLMILTRGITDTYNDAKNARIRRAAMQYHGDPAKIPASVSRGITVDCLIEFLLLDVKNIVDDNETPILFPQFCDMLHNPDYIDLVVACIKAAAVVGVIKKTATDDAKKN